MAETTPYLQSWISQQLVPALHAAGAKVRERDPGVDYDADRAATIRGLLAALARRREQSALRTSAILHPTSYIPRGRLISARAIARRFGIRPHGSWDSRRRGVRLLIQEMRRQGHQVLAAPGSRLGEGGYYLGWSAAEFAGYERRRRSAAIGGLVAAREMAESEEAADAAGQLGLFQSGESRSGAFSRRSATAV